MSEQGNDIGKLAVALSAAQAEFPSIAKNRTANIRSDKGNFSFKYADLAEIISAVQPVLSKHGLAQTQVVYSNDGKHFIDTMLVHGESNQVLKSVFQLPVREVLDPKLFGGSITYFRKYTLCAMLGVAAEEDLDANATPGAQPPGSASAPARPANPSQHPGQQPRTQNVAPAAPVQQKPAEPKPEAQKPTETDKPAPAPETEEQFKARTIEAAASRKLNGEKAWGFLIGALKNQKNPVAVKDYAPHSRDLFISKLKSGAFDTKINAIVLPEETQIPPEEHPQAPADEHPLADIEAFRVVYTNAAKKTNSDVKAVRLGFARWLMSTGMKDKETQIPVSERQKLVDAVNNGQFDFATGSIV